MRVRKTTKDQACRQRRSADKGATMHNASLSSMPGRGAGVSFCREQIPTQARKHASTKSTTSEPGPVGRLPSPVGVAASSFALITASWETSWQRARRRCLHAMRVRRAFLPRFYRVVTVLLPRFYRVSTAFLPCFYLAQSFYRYKKLRVRLCVPAVGCGTLTG
jgi:hypothetical protein